MKSSLTVAALLTAAISLGTVLPAAAQDPAPTAMRHWQNGPHRMLQAGPGNGLGAGRLLMLACSDKGAEALEIALVRMSHRLDLTADQQQLFDAFRTKALTAETSFSDACKAARPGSTASTRPDLLARLKADLAVDQARLTALNGVLPEFEALYNSLSDQQKQQLLPRRGWRMGGPGMGMQRWHNRGPAGRNGTTTTPIPAVPQNS